MGSILSLSPHPIRTSPCGFSLTPWPTGHTPAAQACAPITASAYGACVSLGPSSIRVPAASLPLNTRQCTPVRGSPIHTFCPLSPTRAQASHSNLSSRLPAPAPLHLELPCHEALKMRRTGLVTTQPLKIMRPWIALGEGSHATANVLCITWITACDMGIREATAVLCQPLTSLLM